MWEPNGVSLASFRRSWNLCSLVSQRSNHSARCFGEPWATDLVLQSPKLAFTNKDVLKSVTCNIYEAKPNNVLNALPQVVMVAVVQSQQFVKRVIVAGI
ncbi:hypothetical protein JB92DRAFT_111713 [Gautieria morchelliformis]|nr:hypothetical protein JB92DRAFT_111713 [Gautieria morchelliformis]